MELNKELKNLYKHWEKHTQRPQISKTLDVDKAVLKNISAFINERMKVYENKELDIKPYTHDQILSQFRFCNIYRELDRQTIFFHKLLKPYEKDFPLWLLNMLFCRSICSTETISKIGLLNFDEEHNKEVYKKLLNLESPKYGTAYIFPISVIQRSKWNTREKFFCLYYPSIIKKVALEIETFKNISVVESLEQLLPIFGFNLKFLFTELMIDVAYQYPQYIDLYKEFPIGPGSIPTMKMLNKKQEPQLTNLELVGYMDKSINYLSYEGHPIYLSAENWEGIGCEFRKYTNLSQGRGRRRKY